MLPQPTTKAAQSKQPRGQQKQDEKEKEKLEKEMKLKQKQQVIKPREQVVSECKDYIKMISERCGRERFGKRPLNIAIVGAHGCGKSSFINSLTASLSQNRWIEYAMTGYRHGVSPVTNYISQYPKCCNDGRPMYKNVLLPTLIDIPWPLDNDVDDKRKNFLQFLFDGRIKDLAAATQAHTDYTRPWKYSTVYSNMKIDRVIFVASAVNERLPNSLLKRVMDAAKPPPDSWGLKRQIPVYGVLTNLDKINNTNRAQFETNREEFMKALGLHEGRLLCCSNYCDDTDPEKERFRSVLPSRSSNFWYRSKDHPICGFQVCECKILTMHDDEEMADLFSQLRGGWRKLGSMWQPVVMSLTLAIISSVLMYLMLAAFLTSEQDSMLWERCATGDLSVLDLCNASRSTSSLGIVIATAFVIFVFTMVYHFYQSL